MIDIGQFAASELGNDVITVLSLCSFCLFARYLLREWRRGFLYDETNKAALAMMALCLGLFLLRSWTIALLYATRKHWDDARLTIEGLYPIALVGTAIAAVSFLCLMRVFEDRAWNGWYWRGSLIAAIILTGLVLL